jgi:hypothetical protein
MASAALMAPPPQGPGTAAPDAGRAWDDYAALCSELRRALLPPPPHGQVVALAPPFRRRLLQMARLIASASPPEPSVDLWPMGWRAAYRGLEDLPMIYSAFKARYVIAGGAAEPEDDAPAEAREQLERRRADERAADRRRRTKTEDEEELARRRMADLRARAPAMAEGMFPGIGGVVTRPTMHKVRQMVEVITFEPGIDTGRLASVLYGAGSRGGARADVNARSRVRQLSLVVRELGFRIRSEPGAGPHPARWYIDPPPPTHSAVAPAAAPPA